MTTAIIQQQELNQGFQTNITVSNVENTTDIELNLDGMLMSDTSVGSSGANRKWEFPSEVNATF